MVFMAGPGHGAPGVLGPCYLEGSYSEVYPDCSEDEEGTAAAVQAVLLPRRDRQPLHAGDARLASTRAANSATACRTPAGPRSTTRT